MERSKILRLLVLSVKENQLLLQISCQNSIWKFRLQKSETKKQRKNQQLTELSQICFCGTCQDWEVSYSKKWIYPILWSKRLLKSNILFRTVSFWKARRLEAIFGRLWESLITKHENKIECLGSYHKFWFRTAHLESSVVHHIKLQRTGHFDFTFLVVNANEGINQMELFFLRHLAFNKRLNIDKCAW